MYNALQMQNCIHVPGVHHVFAVMCTGQTCKVLLVSQIKQFSTALVNASKHSHYAT
jgi:hypothetical protein